MEFIFDYFYAKVEKAIDTPSVLAGYKGSLISTPFNVEIMGTDSVSSETFASFG